MQKISFLLLLILSQQHVSALISHVTVFKQAPNMPKQLIFVCADRHHLGSWSDNVRQFLGLSLLPQQTKLKTQFLIENLSSPNEYFNRPQDLAILHEKEIYILSNLTSNYLYPNPTELPTQLHLWGCSEDFFTQLCAFLGLPEKASSFLHNLPIINVDNRQRNIYYGESLCGWNFGPYNHEPVKKIQHQETATLTLIDLLAPQAILREYISKSTGTLRLIFEEILVRQEEHKKAFFEKLESQFGIDQKKAAMLPITQLAPTRQEAFYKFLERSPMQYVLREMIEANALWHITQRTADITIFLAGANHSGHMEGKWIHQTPGLTSYLTQLGYTNIVTRGPSAETLRDDKEKVAARMTTRIPAILKNHIKLFSKQPQ